MKVAGGEFGEYEHQLTVEEMPSHSHNYTLAAGVAAGFYPESDSTVSPNKASTDKTGGDQPHNNVQPSIVVYFWKRTA